MTPDCPDGGRLHSGCRQTREGARPCCCLVNRELCSPRSHAERSWEGGSKAPPLLLTVLGLAWNTEAMGWLWPQG